MLKKIVPEKIIESCSVCPDAYEYGCLLEGELGIPFNVELHKKLKVPIPSWCPLEDYEKEVNPC
jgi:hypothetical protein